MNYIKTLQDIGLKKEEAEIYMISLELGLANVSRLARETSIPRTSIYIHLKKLIEKGFIVKSKRSRGEFFAPVEPSIISEQVLEKARDFANNAIDLGNIMDFADKKPKIEFFDTVGGIKKIYEKILKTDNREVPYLIESGDAVKSVIEKTGIDFMLKFQEKILKKKLITQGLITKNNIEIINSLPENVKSLLRKRFSTVRVIDDEQFPFHINLYLFHPANVIIMVPQENFTLTIENRKVFNSLKTMYHLLYEKAELWDVKKI